MTCLICDNPSVLSQVTTLLANEIDDNEILKTLKNQNLAITKGALVKHKSLCHTSNNTDKRLANKQELATLFDVSLPSIDAWLRRGAPYVVKGTNGVSWKFDIIAISKWLYTPKESSAIDPDNMSPKDQLDWYKAQREKVKYRTECCELMLASAYEKDLSTVLKSLATSLETLPDLLERNAGLKDDAIELVRSCVDNMRESLYNSLIVLTNNENPND